MKETESLNSEERNRAKRRKSQWIERQTTSVSSVNIIIIINLCALVGNDDDDDDGIDLCYLVGIERGENHQGTRIKLDMFHGQYCNQYHSLKPSPAYI